MALAQLFGEECRNPGTVGWLSSGAPLCVTADGKIEQEGGVVFADLPANMLGSFLMGLWQDGRVLGLASPIAIAWVSPQNPFQRMPIFHTAFKTGFCGSLTTFSSWNSAMVVLIFGTGSTFSTQVWLALFGYIIGMETALGSFVCGKSVARFLHRKINPVLALEADAFAERKEEGVYIHWELPDFERRFLSRLDMGEVTYGENVPTGALEDWRKSTENERRVRHPLLPVLIEIEEAVLVECEDVTEEAAGIARDAGWDIDALRQWTHDKPSDMPTVSTISVCTRDRTWREKPSRLFTLPVAAFLAWFLIFALGAMLILLDSDSDTVVTYRTMVYAMLCATPGALLRWKLSEFNGKWDKYPWFPAGTFSANMLGSLMSITAVATEYHIESRFGHGYFWTIGSIRAVRIGFAGCLTTVSTFVAEIHGFMQKHTDCAYPYILTTLSVACLSSTVIYGIIVFLI